MASSPDHEPASAGLIPDLYRADLADRSAQLLHLHPQERRRRALAWARDRDLEGLCELLEAYRYHFGGGQRSTQTERAYRQGVKALLASDFVLLQPTLEAGAAYIRGLERRHAHATISPRLAAARWLYAALIWAGAVTLNPFEKVRPVRDRTDPSSKRQEYTEDEVRRLLSAAQGSQTQLILRLGVQAGLRNMEMVALDWRDVDFAAGELRVRRGKGGKQRRVPLSRGLERALLAHGPSSSGSVLGLSGSTLRRRIRAVAVLAGVSTHGRVTHAMRHAAGVRMVKESRDVQAVADFLGHASLNTAVIYAKKADQRVRKLVGEWED